MTEERAVLAGGCVDFDGAPQDLSDTSAREIYGQESGDAGLDRFPGAALADA